MIASNPARHGALGFILDHLVWQARADAKRRVKFQFDVGSIYARLRKKVNKYYDLRLLGGCKFRRVLRASASTFPASRMRAQPSGGSVAAGAKTVAMAALSSSKRSSKRAGISSQ